MLCIQGNTLLIVACQSDDIPEDLFIDCYNANPRVVNKGSSHDLAPIHHAAYRHLWKVKFLIEKGANINAINEYGNTPIMSAVDGQHIEIVKYLLEQGADIQIKNNKDKNILDICKEYVYRDPENEFSKELEDFIPLLEKSQGDAQKDIMVDIDEKQENEEIVAVHAEIDQDTKPQDQVNNDC